jgi:hypothetical protein
MFSNYNQFDKFNRISFSFYFFLLLFREVDDNDTRLGLSILP